MRYVHKKQSGGSGQFADVAIRYEPGEPGSGFVFKSEIKGGTVPKEYIPGVVKVCFAFALCLHCHVLDQVSCQDLLLEKKNLRR